MLKYIVIRQKFYNTERYGFERHTVVRMSGGYGRSWRPKDLEQYYYDRIELWVEGKRTCKRIRIFKSTVLGMDNNFTLWL